MGKPTDYQYTWAAQIEAFTIFAKYEPDTFAEMSAEHDVIYAGPNPDIVSEEDKARLEELGWHNGVETEYGFYYFT